MCVYMCTCIRVFTGSASGPRNGAFSSPRQSLLGKMGHELLSEQVSGKYGGHLVKTVCGCFNKPSRLTPFTTLYFSARNPRFEEGRNS